MFVYSMKASTLKFFGVIAVSLTVLILLIALIPTYDVAAQSRFAVEREKVKTEEERVAFLQKLGWEVGETAVEEVKVKMPSEFDRVLEKYNRIQLDQGLDLSKYCRKTLTRYTYEVKNYPDYDGTVYANLLVYRNRIVGGDLCSADADGFICGLHGEQ